MIIVWTVVALTVIFAGFRLFFSNPDEQMATTTAQIAEVTSTTGASPTPAAKPVQYAPKEVRPPQGGTVKPPAAVYDGVVTYTSSGFSPKTIEVKAGTTVRFVNKSNMPMRVVATQSSETPGDGGLNQQKSVSNGGTYDFHFSKTGTWLYQNLNDPSKVGAVVVK
jgi:plastocyanin